MKKRQCHGHLKAEPRRSREKQELQEGCLPESEPLQQRSESLNSLLTKHGDKTKLFQEIRKKSGLTMSAQTQANMWDKIIHPFPKRSRNKALKMGFQGHGHIETSITPTSLL